MSSGVQYTRERLAQAAEQCSSLEEVVAYFGTQPYGTLCRYLTERFTRFGIDISHFSTSGRRARPTRDELRAAVSASISIAEALRRLHRPDNGGQRAMLRQWVAEERLTTTHFLGQAHQQGSRARLPSSALRTFWSSTTTSTGQGLTSCGARSAKSAYPKSVQSAESAPNGSASP